MVPKGMTAAELMNKKFPAKKPIIQSVVMEGLNMLGGNKGDGKSFMALDMAIAVAEAAMLWKAFQAVQGDVLFLALEDTMERLKRRLQMRGGCASERITFVTMHEGWNRLDEGGLVALEEWMKEHPKTKFIVLDTLGRVCDVNGSYDNATKTFGDLSRFGHAHHVGILATHHLVKKGSRADVFLNFLGSTGTIGAADTLLALKRQRFQPGAILSVTGKDIEEIELAVQLDRHRGTWSITGKGSDVGLSDERQLVREILTDHGIPMTTDDVRLALAKKGHVKKPGAVRVLLMRMFDAGELSRAGRGRYVVEKEPLQLLPMLPQPEDDGGNRNNRNKGNNDQGGKHLDISDASTSRADALPDVDQGVGAPA